MYVVSSHLRIRPAHASPSPKNHPPHTHYHSTPPPPREQTSYSPSSSPLSVWVLAEHLGLLGSALVVLVVVWCRLREAASSLVCRGYKTWIVALCSLRVRILGIVCGFRQG